jgi:hypothetical protein
MGTKVFPMPKMGPAARASGSAPRASSTKHGTDSLSRRDREDMDGAPETIRFWLCECAVPVGHCFKASCKSDRDCGSGFLGACLRVRQDRGLLGARVRIGSGAADDLGHASGVPHQILPDRPEGFLRNATHLIHDRDPLFTKAWTALLKSGGVQCVPILARSPNCNPHAERFVKTIRTECLDPFVIFGERHLRHLLGEFCAHDHGERFHQGLGGQLITPPASASNDNGTRGAIHRRSRLGGLLNYYYREAA